MRIPTGMWFKIKDYLPTENQNVLLTDGNDICIGYKKPGSEGKMHTFRIISEFKGNSLTHWTILPDLPE